MKQVNDSTLMNIKAMCQHIFDTEADDYEDWCADNGCDPDNPEKENEDGRSGSNHIFGTISSRYRICGGAQSRGEAELLNKTKLSPKS